jgi:hypothetical protein
MKIESLENRQLLAGAGAGADTDVCPKPEVICPLYCAELNDQPGMIGTAFGYTGIPTAWSYTGDPVINKAVVPAVGAVWSYTATPAHTYIVSPVVSKVMENSGAAADTVMNFSVGQLGLAAANMAASVATGYAAQNFILHETWVKFCLAVLLKGIADVGAVVFTTGAGVMLGMNPGDATEASLAGQFFGDAAFVLTNIPGAGTAAHVAVDKGLRVVSLTAEVVANNADKVSKWTAKTPATGGEGGVYLSE